MTAHGDVSAARYAHLTFLARLGPANASFAAVVFGGLETATPRPTTSTTPASSWGVVVHPRTTTTATPRGALGGGHRRRGGVHEQDGRGRGAARRPRLHAMAPWDGGETPCALLFGGLNERIQRVYGDTWKLCPSSPGRRASRCSTGRG